MLKKNSLLFVWKNIHDWRLLTAHLPSVFVSCLKSLLFGDRPQSFNALGLGRAFLQLPELLRTRWRARELSSITDREAFLRPLGLYFRDRFEAPNEAVPERLSVLFAAPYPIEPPTHGGAVFMKMTLEELAPLADVHLVGMVDTKDQLPAQSALLKICSTVEMQPRISRIRSSLSALMPHAVREFLDSDFSWALHRTGYLAKADVVQLEYTQFAQYRGNFRHIPCFLFEHDIHFQSVLSVARNSRSIGRKLHYLYEYFRCFRYELTELPKFTRVQVCSDENALEVTRYLPALARRLDSDLRAGIQCAKFRCVLDGREPDTMLFIGSFRHAPNAEGIRWFVHYVFPLILSARPQAQLIIVGSEPPPDMGFLSNHPNVRFTGFVADISEPLRRYAMFVCPILSGSGIRVKLLEAFASGIPCVSTRLGAEGLASESGVTCELADKPDDFAAATVRLLSDPPSASAMARHARAYLELERDGRTITHRLEATYRREVQALRPQSAPEKLPPGASRARSVTV